MEAKTKNNKSSMRERFPNNIGNELFITWQQMRRIGDPEKIAKALGLSRPIIDRALVYGNVKNEKTADLISKWFAKRLEQESKSGSSIKTTKASKELIDKAKTLDKEGIDSKKTKW